MLMTNLAYNPNDYTVYLESQTSRKLINVSGYDVKNKISFDAKGIYIHLQIFSESLDEILKEMRVSNVFKITIVNVGQRKNPMVDWFNGTTGNLNVFSGEIVASDVPVVTLRLDI